MVAERWLERFSQVLGAGTHVVFKLDRQLSKGLLEMLVGSCLGKEILQMM